NRGVGGVFFRFLISPHQCPVPAPTRSGCPAPVPIRSGWRVVSVPPSLSRHYLQSFPTIGNCCPTSRTRSNMYHYITYPCRRADNCTLAGEKRQPQEPT